MADLFIQQDQLQRLVINSFDLSPKAIVSMIDENKLTNDWIESFWKHVYKFNLHRHAKGVVINSVKESKEQSDSIIKLLISYVEKQNALPTELLYSIDAVILSKAALLSNAMNKKLLEHLQTSYDTWNIKTLKHLSMLSDIEMNIEKLKLDENLIQFLIANEEIIQKYKHRLEPFLKNENKIAYKELLLSCAQTSARKKYPFKPTVIMDRDFNNYVKMLTEMKYPLRERFIIQVSHRVCGDIWINEKGEASFLLIDSLGHSSVNTYCDSFKKSFPKSKTYINDITTQGDGVSCAIFSEDNLVLLHTVENYLPAEFKNDPAPLHSYLEKTTKKFFNEVSTSAINKCILPLRLMLNMQSKKLLDVIKQRKDENELSVNKKGQTAAVSAGKYLFLKYNQICFTNNRIEHKLKILAKENAKYIVNHPKFRSEMLLFGFKHKYKKHQESLSMSENEMKKIGHG